MYFKTTKQYLHCHLSNRAADVRLRTLYKNEAAKTLEHAQKIKAFRRDVAPVVRVELSAGEICVGVSMCHQNVFRGAAVYPISERRNILADLPQLSSLKSQLSRLKCALNGR